MSCETDGRSLAARPHSSARRAIAIGAAALGMAIGVAGAAGATEAPSPVTANPFIVSGTLAPANKGYDATVCGAPSSGVALRQSANDTGTVIRQLPNGLVFHVYRTHNSDSGIPVGWALGYVVGGGTGDDGYTKLAYLC